MPISAVIGRREIMDALPSPLAVFTHGGHALCASAAIANIEFTLKNRLAERAGEMGNLAMARLRELSREHKMMGDIRGRGVMIGVDITKSDGSPDKKSALKVCYAAWKRGLLLITFGKHGNVLRVAPPLIIEKDELIGGIEIIEDCVKDVEQNLVSDTTVENLRGWG